MNVVEATHVYVAHLMRVLNSTVQSAIRMLQRAVKNKFTPYVGLSGDRQKPSWPMPPLPELPPAPPLLRPSPAPLVQRRQQPTHCCIWGYLIVQSKRIALYPLHRFIAQRSRTAHSSPTRPARPPPQPRPVHPPAGQLALAHARRQETVPLQLKPRWTYLLLLHRQSAATMTPVPRRTSLWRPIMRSVYIGAIDSLGF